MNAARKSPDSTPAQETADSGAGRTLPAPRLLLAIAVVLAYANSFYGDFVFDGAELILENPNSCSWSKFPERLFRPRGLVMLTYAVDHSISGFDTWSYHATNLLIHLANTLLLYELIRKTAQRAGSMGMGANLFAWCATALWSCHPVQTESVTDLS